MRLSAIDIGSNAIRQMIVEIKPGGGWKVLKKHREAIRLGSDVFVDGLIHLNTQKRLIPAFKRMAKLNRKFKVERCLAFATSAFRDAKNKKPILSAILKESHIKVKVISGKKEAELIRKAVQNSIGLNNEHSLLIDIGGGSVELTHLQKNRIFYSRSFKWGVVRTLTEAHFQKKSFVTILDAKLKTAERQLPKGHFSVAIGTGGNLDSLARLKLVHLKKGPNTMITFEELTLLYTHFKKTRPEMRAEKFKLRPDRVDVIEPAMYLTLKIMKKYKIKKIKIPGTGLKEGAILSLL
jgi:exopolyphosphatase / guanosine-5'-triphosphate,3'-diphosphate pyrophosphatase